MTEVLRDNTEGIIYTSEETVIYLTGDPTICGTDNSGDDPEICSTDFDGVDIDICEPPS